MNICVVLPAYKEADNLINILPELHKELTSLGISYEIIVVDTMEEMDNTRAVCEKENVCYVPREGGNSYGDAIRTGIIKAEAELILIMDADGSHGPKYIPEMYKQICDNAYDVVIGSRYIKGGDSHNGIILKMMSRILNICYRIAFNIKVADISDSFRLYKASLLKDIDLECKNFDIVEEILIRLLMKKPDLKIKEVPIYFNKRVYGESKRDLVKFIFTYLSTMSKMLRIKQTGKIEESEVYAVKGK